MSEVTIRQLSLRIAELMGRKYDRQFASVVDDIIDFTTFPQGQDPNDWRSFVDQELRVMWGRLDKAVRLVIYITALKASHEAVLLHANLTAANKRNGTG